MVGAKTLHREPFVGALLYYLALRLIGGRFEHRVLSGRDTGNAYVNPTHGGHQPIAAALVGQAAAEDVSVAGLDELGQCQLLDGMTTPRLGPGSYKP